MRRTIQLAVAFVAMLVATAGQVQAGLIVYGTRAAFDVAHPGLAVEDFQDVSSISEVLAGTNITPGVSFALTSGTDAYLAPAFQSGNPTQAIGVNNPRSAGWAMTFSVPVNAVGLDVFQNNGAGSQFGVPIDATVDVFGVSGLLGSFNATIPSGSAGFAGVFSDAELITSLTVNNVNSFDVIDNVEFGATNVSAVPEPSSLALFGIGALGMIGTRRRRKRA